MAKVLIADGAKLARTRLAAVLTEAGHECIEAEDGIEAIESYSKFKPAAVFLDIGLPIRDGLLVLRAIREADPQARVTMFTGNAHYGVVSQASEYGALDFVLKPFDNKRILAALEKMLE